MQHESLSASLIAGVLAGIVGLLVFLTIHHFWIQPIWFILPPGLVIAALGGLAVGWGYAEIKNGLPSAPWTAVAMSAIVFATLIPAILLAQTRPSPIDVSTGTLAGDVTVAQAVMRFVLELLVPATIIGVLMGWWFGHTPRAAVAMALAGFVFALGPGHNIPFLGNTPGVGKGIGLLVAIVIVSSVVLVQVQTMLTRQH